MQVNNQTPFTSEYQQDERITIPVAHGEGNYYCDDQTYQELEANNQIVFRYVDNVNGSLHGIAGICNKAGNVLEMMPHPERAMEELLGSKGWQEVLCVFIEKISGRCQYMNKAILAEPTPQEIKETKLYQQWGLTDEEYQMISEEILGRLPNYTETGLFSVMWSEHCSYKNSKPVLRKFPTEGPQVLQGPGEGAGIVDIGDGQAVVFKAESHNHPSAVEPYEGAANRRRWDYS